jgi:hypothetical protein
MTASDTHGSDSWKGPIVQLDTSTSMIEEYATQRQRFKKDRSEAPTRISRNHSHLITEMYGFYGEFVIAQYYSEILHEDIEVNLQGIAGGDGGIDFRNINGYSVDAKFNPYPHGDLYFTSDSHFKADIGMLVVPTHKYFMKEEYPVFRIAGWIERETFRLDHIHHDPQPYGTLKTTWQGAGRTQTSVPIHCLQCGYHANKIHPIKMPK